MFKNRYLLVLGWLSLSLVAMAVSLSFSDTPSSVDYTDRWEAMGKYYANQAEAQRLKEVQPYVIDSATRSYIAWAETLQVAGNCSNTTQENIFAGIPNNVDSATRSYIGWGSAVQAKSDSRACH